MRRHPFRSNPSTASAPDRVGATIMLLLAVAAITASCTADARNDDAVGTPVSDQRLQLTPVEIDRSRANPPWTNIPAGVFGVGTQVLMAIGDEAAATRHADQQALAAMLSNADARLRSLLRQFLRQVLTPDNQGFVDALLNDALSEILLALPRLARFQHQFHQSIRNGVNVFSFAFVEFDDLCEQVHSSLWRTTARVQANASLAFDEFDRMIADGVGADPGRTNEPQEPQMQTWQRSSLPPNTTRLFVSEGTELPLKGVEARVLIEGFRARVVLDYYFYKASEWPTEGQFQVRLPVGASVCYFAFGASRYEVADLPEREPRRGELAHIADVRREFDMAALAELRVSEQWSQPKEAVVAPRTEARVAYLATTARRVDPALLEWSGPQVFSGRVFPLETNTLHRVVLGYDIDLVRLGAAPTYRFELPLPRGVMNLAATVEVRRVAGARVVEVSPAVTPTPRDTTDEYSFAKLSAYLESTLTLTIAYPADLMLVGTDRSAGEVFAADVVPPPTAMAEPDDRSADRRSRAVFLLDTSLSTHPDAFNRWRDLVRSVLQENSALREFNVLRFDITARWLNGPAGGWIANTEANRRRWIDDELGQTVLGGATDLGHAISTLCRATWCWPRSGTHDDSPGGGLAAAPLDVFFLSDGSTTWGIDDWAGWVSQLKHGPPLRLWAYSSAAIASRRDVLNLMTAHLGGAVIPLDGSGADDWQRVATAHTKPLKQIREVRVDGAVRAGGDPKSAEDVFVGGGFTALVPGVAQRIAGRRVQARADGYVRVTWSTQNSVTDALTELVRPVLVISESQLASRTFGVAATAELDALPTLRPAANEFGRYFHVVGPSRSMLMLESKADYERMHIRTSAESTLVGEFMVASHVARELAMASPSPRGQFARAAELLAHRAADPAVSACDYRPTPELAQLLDLIDECWPTDDSLANADPAAATSWAATPASAGTAEAFWLANSGQFDAAVRVLSQAIELGRCDHLEALGVARSVAGWGQFGAAYRLFWRELVAHPGEFNSHAAVIGASIAANRLEVAALHLELALGLMGSEWDRLNRRRSFEMRYWMVLRDLRHRNLASVRLRDFVQRRFESLRQALGIEVGAHVVAVMWNDSTRADLVLSWQGRESDAEGWAGEPRELATTVLVGRTPGLTVWSFAGTDPTLRLGRGRNDGDGTGGGELVLHIVRNNSAEELRRDSTAVVTVIIDVNLPSEASGTVAVDFWPTVLWRTLLVTRPARAATTADATDAADTTAAR